MKICIYNVTSGFKTGGIETNCWEVACALHKAGHEAHIMSGEGAPRYTHIPFLTFPYTPRDQFPNFGTRFRKFAERHSFAKQAFQTLEKEKYDVVIVTKPYDFPVLRHLKRRGFQGITVMNCGGTEFYFGDRFFAKAVDLWISTSHYNAKQIAAHYGTPISVIHNAVDPDIFTKEAKDALLRSKLGIPEDAFCIVSTGRLVGWKGLHIIIEALANVPEAHYVIVGDGEKRASLEALSQTLGVAGRVHFVGEQKHKDLPPLIAACDLFVQPSVGEEAFGISVIEGMSCSLPVLGSHQGGIAEIITHGKDGYLLPTGDIPAWQAALLELSKDRLKTKAMGEAARDTVRKRFTWEEYAQKLLHFIEEIKQK